MPHDVREKNAVKKKNTVKKEISGFKETGEKKRSGRTAQKESSPYEAAREAALNLLDYQDRSAGELKERLLRKSHSQDEVERVVASLQASGLVDDRRYARIFAQSKLEAGKGRIYILQKLREKKIPSAIAEDVLSELLEEEDESLLCLKKALSLCGLSYRYEINESGELFPVDELQEPIDFFQPKDDAVRRDRQACRIYRQKAKNRLARRLVSAGFPVGAAFDAVRKIEDLANY